jgi:hypothetical protein
MRTFLCSTGGPPIFRPALRGGAASLGWALRAGAAALGVDNDLGRDMDNGDGDGDGGDSQQQLCSRPTEFCGHASPCGHPIV